MNEGWLPWNLVQSLKEAFCTVMTNDNIYNAFITYIFLQIYKVLHMHFEGQFPQGIPTSEQLFALSLIPKTKGQTTK